MNTDYNYQENNPHRVQSYGQAIYNGSVPPTA
jgi:hypothetical protein